MKGVTIATCKSVIDKRIKVSLNKMNIKFKSFEIIDGTMTKCTIFNMSDKNAIRTAKTLDDLKTKGDIKWYSIDEIKEELNE